MNLVPGRQRAGQARRDEVMAEKEAVSDRETEPPYTEQAQLLRVMAHPVRLRVLEALADRSQCVKDLNSLVPIVQPHLSQHVAALRKAGLIDCHANGTLRYYYLLRPSLVRRMIRLLREKHPSRSRSRDSVLREARRASGKRKRVARGSVPPASRKTGPVRRREGGGVLGAH